MSASSTTTAAQQVVVNVPNTLTALRLLLSLVLFVLLAYQCFAVSFVLFVLATSTDWLDGYYARRYGQVTMLGRVLDPFVDKVIVCGALIFLAAEPASGIRPWMAVLVVGRELLVTVLRSLLEQRGQDFSAQFSGKLKMLLQCIAAAVSMFALSWQARDGGGSAPWLGWLLSISVWSAVVLTIYSGAIYIRSAARMLRSV